MGLPIKTGIIGLGRWGKELVKASPTGLQITKASVKSLEKHRAYALENNLELVESWKELVEDPTIELILIATPHSQHFAQIKKSIENKKNVFTEPPLSMSSAESKVLIELANQNEVHLRVGFNFEFLPGIQKMRSTHFLDRIGEISYIEMNYMSGSGYRYSDSPDHWRASLKENPVGPLSTMGLHMIDLIVSLFGGVETAELKFAESKLCYDFPHLVTSILKLNCGAVANLTTVNTTLPIFTLKIYGSKGWVNLTEDYSSSKKSLWIDHSGPSSFTILGPCETLKDQLIQLIEEINAVDFKPFDKKSALHTMDVYEALTKSARDGGEIKVKT